MPGWGETILGNPKVKKYTKEHTKDKDAVTAKKSVEEIDRYARKLASKAEKMGYKIAAKHLRRYLDGTGGTEHPKRRWLRSYKKIRDAEARIRENFQEKTIISKIGNHIAKDNQFTFTDWFDGNIRYMIGEFSHEELFLATGDSSIRATGNFAATIKGERVIVTGKVRYKWYDDYNFHKGLGIWVPGEGHIPDAAMRKLNTHGNAKDFHMQRIWHQTLKADFLLGDAPYAIDWRWGEAF